MAEPFRFTTGRWYNRYDPETERTAKAPAYREGFTYAQFEYGHDYPEEFLPDPHLGQGIQTSLICAPQTRLLVADVDYPEQLAGSAAGQFFSWADAVSTRGSHFHAGIDMTGAPPELWPVQGRTVWGDIKSSGFVAAPGSVHFSGEPYAAAPGWQAKLLRWAPELLAALEADKLALVRAKRESWGLGGTRLPDGAYLYASGYAGGSWELIPDGGLQHDDELKDLVHDMHVLYGREEEEVREHWFRLAGALGKPWTERDFLRHWRRVPAMRAEVLEQDDATRFREDFGLELLQPALEAEESRQREQYTERAARQLSGDTYTGFGPPTPVPPGGFEAGGFNYLPLWLGAHAFDAGRPTDADNALAVLQRAVDVLRFDDESGSWLIRDTGCWRIDDDGPQAVIMELRSRLPEGCADPLKHPLYEHLDPDADAGAIAALKRHAKNTERFATASTVAAVARLMKAIALQYRQAGGTVRAGTLDADPEILWAGGVPFDLRASLHGPAVTNRVPRNTPHLHSAGCVPDASVPTPLWDELTREVWVDSSGKPDPELAAWALLVLSAGATGYPKKVIPVLKGGTDRGKSTVIDALADVLGSYFGPLNPKVLDAGTSTHDTVLMELKGRRLTFLDEGIRRGTMATTRLKRLAGGSAITANRMRQDPVTFKPMHTLVITLNPEDSFSFDDPAVDSRIRLLPCDGNPEAVITTSKKFNYFKSQAWLDERAGVLARLMQAAAYMLSDDRAMNKDHAPVAVQMAEQGVKDEEDDVLRWFMEATADCPDGYPSRDLFIAFREWTRETKGDKGFIPSETKWGLRMNELVPEDVAHKLVTANKSRLRRRRPAQPGSGGSSPPPTLRDFMTQGKPFYPPAGAVPDTPVGYGAPEPYFGPGYSPPEPERGPGYSPPEPERGQGPGNPPDSPTHRPTHRDQSAQVSSVVPVGTVGTVGINHSYLQDKETPPTTSYYSGTGETHRPTGPPDDLARQAGPVVPDKAVQPESGENTQNGQNAVTPPNRKTPRTKLTPEEKLARAEAGKALRAKARAEAKTAKVAELGGRLVQLPAVVLRDQSILEVDAGAARVWLEGCLDELSVDVEHSGFPRMHKDYRLRLVQLGNEGSAVVFDPADPDQAAVIREALRAAKVLHAHSALADLIPLEAAGLCDGSVWDRMQDTVILAKLTDPALCDSDEFGLKALAKNLLGPGYALSWQCEELKKAIFTAGGWLGECEVTTPVERSGWAQIPVNEGFVRYAASDVMDCSAVARVLQERAS